ncbi:MAG: hypothetical protein OHK0039_25400 [Bacteroidia bacterium]
MYRYLLLLLPLLCTAPRALAQPATQPGVQVEVHREMNEQGRVVRYDSSYRFTWTSDSSTTVNMDSLFQQMMGAKPGMFFLSDSLLRARRDSAHIIQTGPAPGQDPLEWLQQYMGQSAVKGDSSRVQVYRFHRDTLIQWESQTLPDTTRQRP